MLELTLGFPNLLLTLVKPYSISTEARGHGEMVSHEPSKLLVRVRFPLPAPVLLLQFAHGASRHDKLGRYLYGI